MDRLPEHFEVHGTVTGREGRPTEGARVVVWHRRLRDRRELVAGETGERGDYRVRFHHEEAPERLLIEVEASGGGLSGPLSATEPTGNGRSRRSGAHSDDAIGNGLRRS